MPSQEDVALVERWFHDLFGRANIGALDDLAAPDFVSYFPDGRVAARDREAFRGWLGWYLASFTEGDWTIHDVIGDGEKVVVRYSGRTTYRGGLLDIPSAGQRVTEMGVLIFRIEGGRVHEVWSALCDLDLVLALGAIPVVPPSAGSEVGV